MIASAGWFYSCTAVCKQRDRSVIGILTYLTAPALIGLFSKTPAVLALGVLETRTISLFYFLLAFSHAVASVCRGAGKAFVPMVIMLLFWCVVRITYITIVMRIIHEIQYIYMAYPITWSLSSIVYFLYYHFSDWVHGFDKPYLSEFSADDVNRIAVRQKRGAVGKQHAYA